MRYSLLSRYVSTDPLGRFTLPVTWVIRVLTGAVFIFSGFVKAVDPWGTLYKMEDYLAAMGLHLWPNLVVVGAFVLCAIEFLLGIFLLFGCFRRGSAIASLVLMCFMLPLTLWIACFDPVDDCGCFGDAVILSNWATFWKNVLLTAFVLWLVVYNRRCKALITPALQWIAFVVTSLFIVAIELVGFEYQPLLDFRPYEVGTSLTGEMQEDSDEPEYVFVYSKDGVEKEFAMDSLPDESEGWEFVDRKMVGEAPQEDDADGFHVWEGDEDVTEEVLYPDRKRLLLLMPDLGAVTIATTWKINSLHDWASSQDIDMVAAVAGSQEAIANWEDLSMPEYPIYTADDTAIKELVRGNPALVYTEDGIIKWKRTLKALDVDDFLAPEISHDPMSFAVDNHRILRNSIFLYLAVMLVLVAFTLLLPKLPSLFKLRFPRLHRLSVRHHNEEN